MFSIQNVYSATISALSFVSPDNKDQYSFRLKPGSRHEVIFGPARWSTSEHIDHRLWLSKNGFDMSDIDRVEKILSVSMRHRADTEFLIAMNKKLRGKEMLLSLAQKSWCASELNRITKIDGMDFAKATNTTGAFVLWHNIEHRILSGDEFCDRWAFVSSKNKDKGLAFTAEYLHWRLSSTKEGMRDPSSCIKRYGIIIDKINY